MHTLYFTLYTPHCSVHTAHYTLHTALYTQQKRPAVRAVLKGVRNQQPTVQQMEEKSPLIVHCTGLSVQSSLYTMA